MERVLQEAVTESAAENHRRVEIVIYMCFRGRVVCRGEPQPTAASPSSFLKRLRSPRTIRAALGVGDIGVGSTVTFYGRFSSPAATRSPASISPPRANLPRRTRYARRAHRLYRATLKKDTVAFPYPPAPRNDVLAAYIEASNGAPSHLLVADKLEKFLANDRKVLRFFCVWDDRGALYGEKRPFVLHYYLADDSVEVLEVAEPNSGRDPFPVFLRRQPLPNKKLEVDALGPTKSYTYYTHKDCASGTRQRVRARVLIHDADNFTKAWYIQNEGTQRLISRRWTWRRRSCPSRRTRCLPTTASAGSRTRCRTAWRSSPSPCAPTSTSR